MSDDLTAFYCVAEPVRAPQIRPMWLTVGLGPKMPSMWLVV